MVDEIRSMLHKVQEEVQELVRSSLSVGVFLLERPRCGGPHVAPLPPLHRKRTSRS